MNKCQLVVIGLGATVAARSLVHADAVDPAGTMRQSVVAEIVLDHALVLQVDFKGDINPQTGAGGALASVATANWGEVSLEWVGFIAGNSWLADIGARHMVGPHGEGPNPVGLVPGGNGRVVAPNPVRVIEIAHGDHVDRIEFSRLVDCDGTDDVWRITAQHRDDSVQAGLRHRKNYMRLTAGERRDFVAAVKALKANPEAGRIGVPPNHCDYTNTYDKYVCWHAQCGCQGVGEQQHSRPQFLPWHRELLRQFELELRSIGGQLNLTIPFWDWTQPFPSHIDEDGVDDWGFMGDAPEEQMSREVSKGPFAGTCQWTTQGNAPEERVALQRGHASPVGTLNRGDLAAALGEDRYDSDPWHGNTGEFRSTLEALHDRAHGWVGGDEGQMSDPKQAAEDPVFWLHHCFVDLLWATWQEVHWSSRPYLPDSTSPDPDDHQNDPPGAPDDIDARMFPWPVTTTPRTVLDIEALGYTYCTGDVDPNRDGDVGILDLLALLAAWGPCAPDPQPCPGDLTHDGTVDIRDLIQILLQWGPCAS